MMDSLHYAARRIGCPLFVFWLASGMVYCLPADATDFEGVLPAALDQPRIEFLMRNSAVGPPLLSTGLPGDGNHYNVQAFLDTGASGVLISQETAGYFALEPLRWPEPNGPEVEFADVGVAGSDIFHVTQPLYFSTTTSSGETFEDPPLGSYTQTFGPVRAQVGPLTADPNPFLQNLDILGMPAMTGKVVVMDPRPADPLNNPALDLMRTYIYNPGTPFNPGTSQTNPGIPAVERHVELSYASFDRFTDVTPAGAPGPTLRSNPFIGPNPLLKLDDNPPPDGTPPVTITLGGHSSTGSWLLDTGAAASIISLEQAANLHVRYVPGTKGTENPRLETFDPSNPNQPGTAIPDQFTLPVGGVGGITNLAGFYLDSLVLPTMEGNAANADDPNHMRFLSTGVLVSDITLQDPISQETLTLDGIFGMNMLVASASFSSGPGGLPIIDAFQDGYFNWVVFDEPNGRLGFDLKEFVEPAPNEWSRSTSGNWDVDGNWSFGIVPAGTSETALLGKSLLSDGTVNLATTDVTLRGLRFNNDAASYTVTSTGGTLRFESASGPALIQLDIANTESHEIAAPIQIASDLNIDATLSTLTLSGSQRWDAGRTVAVRTGTVRFNLGAEDTVIVDGNNQLRIDDGAIVQLEGVKSPLAGGGSLLDVVSYVDVTNNSSGGLLVAAGNHEAGAISGSGSTSLVGGSLSAASFHQSSLSIGTGATARVRLNGTDNATSVLGALSLAGTPSSPSATFDLADNAAVIDYSGASPAGAVRQQIIAGRGGVGLGKGWNGIGITSSAAAAANTTNPESRSIGYAENDTLPLGVYSDFHGQPVDATSLLLAYTRTGDANLDGVVNDEDVTIVSATYAPGTAQASWALGDFDYNGFVDDDDITLLSAFYDPSAPPLIIGGTQLGTAPENVAAVPEPGSAVLAAIATLLAVFLRHNRRRTCRRC